MADADFEPDPDFVPDEPAPRKSKYPGPKPVSDEDVGLETGPIRTHRVPGTTLNFVDDVAAIGENEKAYQAKRSQDLADKTVTDLAMGGGAAGGLRTAIAGKLAKNAALAASEKNALAALGKSGAKPIAERIADALGKTVEHSIWARGIQLLAPSAIETGKKALTPALSAARAGAPAVAGTVAGELGSSVAVAPAEEPAPFKGVMSNAVDRLRASAGNNPRAADLLARMEASKNTPTGTVTQGTGAH